MSIDELLEKTTIKLPRSLTLKEAEKLIYYLAKELPANIHYHTSRHRSIFRSYGEGNRKILEQDGTVKINVNINNIEKPLALDSFQLQASDQDRDTSKLSVIRFNLVPGWELPEYRPEVRELWDKVRGKVGQYFE